MGVRNSRIQDEARANGAIPRSQRDETGAWSGSWLGCWGQSQVPLSARWESQVKASGGATAHRDGGGGSTNKPGCASQPGSRVSAIV